MEFFSLQLFLGFPVDSAFEEALKKVPTARYALYIQPDHLEDFYYKNRRYLGKRVEGVAMPAELELLEENIYSMLKLLIPDYPYEATPLLLFPFPTPLEK